MQVPLIYQRRIDLLGRRVDVGMVHFGKDDKVWLDHWEAWRAVDSNKKRSLTDGEL